MAINKDRATQNYLNRKAPIFQAMYSFLHPSVCGPVQIVANNSGYLVFPDKRNLKLEAEDVYCIWDLFTKPRVLVQFTIGNKTFYEEDCMKHSITLSSSVDESEKFLEECGKSRSKTNVVQIPGTKNNGHIKLKVKMKNLNVGKFQLSWIYAAK